MMSMSLCLQVRLYGQSSPYDNGHYMHSVPRQCSRSSGLCSQIEYPQALQGAFTDVLEGTVKKDSFLYRWLDYLSFALR